jgi:hypothetical protein
MTCSWAARAAANADAGEGEGAAAAAAVVPAGAVSTLSVGRKVMVGPAALVLSAAVGDWDGGVAGKEEGGGGGRRLCQLLSSIESVQHEWRAADAQMHNAPLSCLTASMVVAGGKAGMLCDGKRTLLLSRFAFGCALARTWGGKSIG